MTKLEIKYLFIWDKKRRKISSMLIRFSSPKRAL